MGLPPSLQAVQLWPIHTKGAIIRHSPLGDPSVEKAYHEALEDGRWLEKNIADANHWLLQKQQYWKNQVSTYLSINKVAVDGQLRHTPRAIKYIADSIQFLQQVNKFQQEIIGITQALTSNIQIMVAMEQSLLALVQANLNGLALLLNNVCNWHLPNLPSLPMLLPDGMFNWNGFAFSSLAEFALLKPNLSFNTNFAFNQCALGLPGLGNPAANPPASILTYSGLPLGTPQYVPPLGGNAIPPGQDPNDPAFIAQMQQQTSPPVYGATFNPNSSMLGSVPDPNTIISDFQMPAQTYQNNIVSIVPDLRSNVVEPGDADYNNPNLATRQPSLQKALGHFITLDAVVNSSFDPYITSAWLFYLSATRGGRGGIWIPNFQAVYDQYIQPSVTKLTTTAVPWNNVLGGSGVQDTPTDIPLVDTLQAFTSPAQQTLLWQLSYIEAALLGYTRSKTWDAFQNANYLSGPTGSDLDYLPTTINTATVSTIVLGQGTAAFPTSMIYPTAMTGILNQVIAQATLDIAADTTYESPRLGNRFTFNQFAQATLVDRFTQFWRDFNTNMVGFLAQDPYLIAFATTYFGTLNGALNPLGGMAAYNSLQTDASERNRTWIPGTPLLLIPVAPIVNFSNDSTPASGDTGWQGIQFNPVNFLARPDIQGQPIPVQNAMMRTNLSYAGLLQFQQAGQAAIANQIANAQALLTSAQEIGFQVTDTTFVTNVPASSNTPVAFDTIVFDLTGNVTNSTTFTIQATGEYAYFGSVHWLGTDTGQPRTITVLQNAQAIYTQSSDPSFTAPLDVQFSGYGNFAAGDVVQVIASHGFSGTEQVGPGSFFGMIQSGPVETPPQIPADDLDRTNTFTADATMSTAPTAFNILANGHIAPIDPTIVVGHLQATITNIVIVSNVLTVTCNNTFTVGATVFFNGLTNASFLNGQAVVIVTRSGTQFTANVSTTTYGSASDTGTANSGGVLFPFIDGITTTPVTSGHTVECGIQYGGIFQIEGATFTPGALLYVGPGGVLTQNYALLLTEVQWIICAGRAITSNTMIYEPSLPLQAVNLS